MASLNQLTFGGKQLGVAVEAFTTESPAARSREINLFGVNGELSMNGGRGGRSFSISAFIKAKNQSELETTIQSLYEKINTVETLKVLTNNTANNREMKDVRFDGFTETTDRIPDVVGMISPGGVMVRALFRFRQLRVEK